MVISSKESLVSLGAKVVSLGIHVITRGGLETLIKQHEMQQTRRN